jgi:endonuclease/exonuclease/phosphatase (EEP) superfamily protein YafD
MLLESMPSVPPPPKSGFASQAHRVATHLGGAAVVLIGIAMILGLLARWSWELDLLNHFALQFSWGLAVLTVFLATLRAWRLVLAGGLLGVFAIFPVALAYTGQRNATPHAPVVRVLFLNLLSSNAEHTTVLEHLAGSEADFIVLAEVHHRWMPTLEQLEGRGYPYSITEPQSDNFGIAIFSRHPIEGRIENIGGNAAPPSAIVVSATHALTLIGTHPVPPVSPSNAALRDQQLRAVAARAKELGGRVAVIGDLNVTPWSPIFSSLLRDGELHDSRRGFGVQTTWPADFPALARIPIDHVLTSTPVVATRREVGPFVGSDHRSVTVDLSLE